MTALYFISYAYVSILHTSINIGEVPVVYGIMVRPPTVQVTSQERLEPPLPTTLLRKDVTIVDVNGPHDPGPSLINNATTTVSDELPNRGLPAWLHVAGSFFLFFNSWYIYPQARDTKYSY